MALEARADVTVPPERSSPARWRLLTAFAILPVVQALVAFVAFPLTLGLPHDFLGVEPGAWRALGPPGRPGGLQ